MTTDWILYKNLWKSHIVCSDCYRNSHNSHHFVTQFLLDSVGPVLQLLERRQSFAFTETVARCYTIIPEVILKLIEALNSMGQCMY